MSDDKLKDIIQQKVQQWEQSEIITGEPQPSELVWDKLYASLPAKSWSLLQVAILFSSVAVISFTLGYAAYNYVGSEQQEQIILDDPQSSITESNIVTTPKADTNRIVKKRTIEIIDMDSIEKSKEKDYILYNNSKIYIDKDSTTKKSTTTK